MISVKVITNVGRTERLFEEEDTLRTIFEDEVVVGETNIDYNKGGINIDGCSLRLGDIDKSLNDLNITERCSIFQVIKADNASK